MRKNCKCGGTSSGPRAILKTTRVVDGEYVLTGIMAAMACDVCDEPWISEDAVKVLVCGGRDFADYKLVCRTLDEIHAKTPIIELIHGAAKGADALGDSWAKARGVMRRSFPADWGTYGRAAGPIRNQQMLDLAGPDLVVAFQGGTGTKDMMARARKQGFKVIQVKE